MKKVIYLGNEKVRFEYSTLKQLQREAKKYNIIIGAGCYLGAGCSLLSRTRILRDTKPINYIFFKGYYKHLASGYIDKKTKKIVIQLGCFVRFLEDWEKDFDNNPKEFPKGSEDYKERREVYLLMKKILLKKLMKKILLKKQKELK